MPVFIAIPVIGKMPVIIIPEIMDPFKRESADTVGNTPVTDRNPGATVIGGRVPDISPVEVITIRGEVQVIGNSRGNIKTQFRRSYKFRRLFDNYRLGSIHRSDYGRNAEINPHAYTNAGSLGLCNRYQQGNCQTE
jgi:hypothetical protein